MNRMLRHLALTREYQLKSDHFLLLLLAVISSTPPHAARWQTNAVTVAGGHGYGNGTDQLKYPHGLFVDEHQTVYIADWMNHRIVAWKANATTGGIFTDNHLDELSEPTDVIVDRATNSLLICDRENRRVLRWPRCPALRQFEIALADTDCPGLTMDDQGALYVSIVEEHEVRRFDRDDDQNGTIVAGGHGQGADFDQLNHPSFLFVDAQFTVYVSDSDNHRVMAWMKGASEGMVVAGGNGKGDSLEQLYYPKGVWVDASGHIYVADKGNARVMRWEKGAKQGTVIAGGNGNGIAMNQLSGPNGLFFDRHGHL